VTGDWNGDGVDTPGIVVVSGGVLAWHLRNSNTSGVADVALTYGGPGMLPVVGDWNGDGAATPGIVVNSGSVRAWHLRNSNTSGVADVAFTYGNAG
jgi:hypothetical protein